MDNIRTIKVMGLIKGDRLASRTGEPLTVESVSAVPGTPYWLISFYPSGWLEADPEAIVELLLENGS